MKMKSLYRNHHHYNCGESFAASYEVMRADLKPRDENNYSNMKKSTPPLLSCYYAQKLYHTCIKRPFDLSHMLVILSRPNSNKNVSMKSLDFSSHLVMMSPLTSFITRFPLSLSSSILFWNRNFFSFKKLTFRSFAV